MAMAYDVVCSHGWPWGLAYDVVCSHGWPWGLQGAVGILGIL